MRGVFNVFWFTFREKARKKSFIISTIITYVLIIAVICIPSIINSFNNSNNSSKSTSGQNASTSTSTVYVIDSDKILSNNLSELADNISGYKFVLKQPSAKTKLMNSIKGDSSLSLVVLTLKNGSPSFDFYTKSINDGPNANDISETVKKIYGEELLKQGGVSPTLIKSAYTNVTYSSSILGRGTASGMLASIAVTLLLFMFIYMYGYWVAMSIASEKTSRVMEVLITSTKPSRIVIGKSLGMGILGFCQLLGIIIVGSATYLLTFPKNFEISGVAVNLSCFTPLAVLMILIYFIFGFALYAMMYAVCGATVSKAEDIQQSIMPVALISMVSFYFAYISMAAATESSATMAASLIPFTSPFTMPSRILSASVPAWQILLSLVILAVTTALLGFISIRLYSSAVLHYGKRLKISELVQMSKAK